MNLNKVSLIGQLTRDPELKSLKSGVSVATFGLATNHKWTDHKTKEKKESVEFHNIVCWRKLAEIVNRYLKKGEKIFVEGRITNRSWEGKDGQKKYRTEVIADNLIMLSGNGSRGNAAKADKEMAPEEVDVQEVPVEA